MDLKLGHLWLPTATDAGESAGDGIETLGPLITGAEARPRDVKLVAPIYGQSDLAIGGDSRELGHRLRRQWLAYLDNARARLQPAYLRWTADPELNGWVIAGGGDVGYEESRGPVAGEFVLELADVKRAGTLRTHRPGVRFARADRRAATTPRDILGNLYSVELAGKTALELALLPVALSDVVGSGRYVLDAATRRAFASVVASPAVGSLQTDVLSYELSERAIAAPTGEVRVYDRRGATSSTDPMAPTRVNRIPDPQGSTVAGFWEANSTAGATIDQAPVSRAWPADRERTAVYFKATNPSASPRTLSLRTVNSATRRFNVTAGRDYLLAVELDVLQMPLGVNKPLRLTVSWRDAAGAGLASDGGARIAAVGRQRLVFKTTAPVAPAGVAQAYFTLEADATAAGEVLELYATSWQLEDLGVASIEADRPYGDGDVYAWRWLGPPGQAMSATDEAIAAGWEEILGPDQELSTVNVAGVGVDVPVLTNDLCRVRYLATRQAWAIDSWDATSLAWVELGRVNVWREHGPGTLAQLANLIAANVLEWTPERAVVKALIGQAGNRLEVYITLQRGWTAPRFEVYPLSNTVAPVGSSIRFVPAGADTVRALKGTQTDGFRAWTDGQDLGAFTSDDPYVAIFRDVGTLPTVVMSVLQANVRALARSDTLAYGTARIGIGVDSQAGSYANGYCSVTFAVTAAPALVEAETYRNAGSGTTSQVADGGDAGGQAIEETQAANTANTTAGITPTAVGLGGAGTVAVWALVRVVTAGATLTANVRIGSTAQPIVTYNGTTYAWVRLGEVNPTSMANDIAVRLWRTVGTGAVRVAKVLLVPLERRGALGSDYDGVRDHWQANLIDSRPEPILCRR